MSYLLPARPLAVRVTRGGLAAPLAEYLTSVDMADPVSSPICPDLANIVICDSWLDIS
jgi:hypothetical protein